MLIKENNYAVFFSLIYKINNDNEMMKKLNENYNKKYGVELYDKHKT